MSDYLFSAFILFAIYLACSCLWHERKARIPPVPVLPHVKRRAIKLALEHTDATANYKIIDLGCGWGGVMLSLARTYKNAHITGYEISPWPYRFAKLRTLFKRRRIKVTQQDFFTADIADQDLVYCYLHPETIKELRPKFQTLKHGALIISCSFPIPEWTPMATTTLKLPVKLPIYIYKVGAQ
jgi:2-polyprenyl-3-methyl-5-hydroxy-6-metoxy-1,4-benzoquinol methylase